VHYFRASICGVCAAPGTGWVLWLCVWGFVVSVPFRFVFVRFVSSSSSSFFVAPFSFSHRSCSHKPSWM
jgi:hypothetical protein